MTHISRHLNKLGKESIIYGLSRAGASIVSMLLLPVFTRVLSPEDYGTVDIITAGISLFSLIAGMQIDSGVARYYYEYDIEKRGDLLSTGLYLRVLFSMLLFFCLLPFTGHILRYFPSINIRIFFMAVSLAILMVIFNYLLMPFRFERAAVKYSILSVGQLFSMALCSIYFVVFKKWGVYGVFAGYVFSYLLFTIIALWLLRSMFSLTISLTFAKDVLKYGLPTVPAVFATWFKTYIYRFLLVPLVGLAEVGIYSSGLKVSGVITLFVSAFSLAWFPFAMSILRDENHRIIYAKILTYYTIILATVAFLITLFAREIIHILLPSPYWKAGTLVGFISIALVLDGIFMILGIGLNIRKMTYLNTAAFLIGSAIGIVLLVLLIPALGITGAAIATMLGAFISVLVEAVLSQRSYYINYEWNKIVGVFSLLIFSNLAVMLIDRLELDLAQTVGLKAAMLVLFFVGLRSLAGLREASSWYMQKLGARVNMFLKGAGK
ncbi:MAG: oligosaccharide flippase family protein [Nitrospirae bacterium]|nr:oligosaccharide flippase family protein [Nitrospirota bacterium]